VTINSDRDIRISTVETIWKLLMETLELTLMPFYARAQKLFCESFQRHKHLTIFLFLRSIKTDIDEKNKENA